jgi:flagellar protein FlaF
VDATATTAGGRSSTDDRRRSVMGVSVSVSTAIVFLGVFAALGVLYPSVANGYEQIREAETGATDRHLDAKNTEMTVTNATYASGTLTVDVANTGTTALAVGATDVLVDGGYQTSFASRSVDGDATTDLWMPGETLTVSVSVPTRPDRVVVVTEGGVEAGVSV